jgi:hypothetical protein
MGNRSYKLIYSIIVWPSKDHLAGGKNEKEEDAEKGKGRG